MNLTIIIIISLIFAVLLPKIYLLGMLTSVVPSYLFLFKKAKAIIQEIDPDNVLCNTHESIIFSTWTLVCGVMWWVLLLISFSEKRTNSFIYSFVDGVLET